MKHVKFILYLTFSFLLTFIAQSTYAQCRTLDSVYIPFTSGNITITNFPGNAFLPRTDANAITTALYSEGRSSNPGIFSKATDISPVAPARSNVFFGGNDATNGQANTQLISKKTYNLHNGPITLKCFFHNRSAGGSFNESYLGIVPSSYVYYAPLDCSPGNNNAARETIACGSVNGANTAFLFDHGTTMDNIRFVVNHTPSGVDFSKWYSIEVTFEIKDNDLYVSKAIYNDGTQREPIGNWLKIGNVSGLKWVESFNVLVGVDDLASDLTIIQKDCECPVTANDRYDLDTTQIFKAGYTGSSTQAAPDFSKTTKPLILESSCSNDGFYAISTQIYGGAPARNSVYFAGDATNGQQASVLVTNKTYNLLNGKLTVWAKMLNRSNAGEYNETWISLLPAGYKYYMSAVHPVNASKEGLRIGGWPTKSFVVNHLSELQNDLTVAGPLDHTLGKFNSWYTVKAVFDTSNNNFRLYSYEIDHGSGFQRVWNSPVIIGKTSDFPWISNLRIAVCTDDLADSLGITQRSCAVQSCSINTTSDSTCKKKENLRVSSLFRVNGKPPFGSGYRIISFNDTPNHPLLATVKLLSDSLLPLDIPFGKWGIEIVTSCGNKAISHFKLLKSEQPQIRMLDSQDICSSTGQTEISRFVDHVSKSPGNWSWTGQHINQDKILSIISGDSMYSSYRLARGIYTSTDGCFAETILNYRIRQAPDARISRNTTACQGLPVEISATLKCTRGAAWDRINPSDGVFSNTNRDSTTYFPGPNDRSNRRFTLLLQTLQEKNDPCPVARDSVTVLIHPLPDIMISDSLQGCEPLRARIYALERSGIPKDRLKFSWTIMPNNQAYDKSDTITTNLLQGKYSIDLLVTDTMTRCQSKTLKNNCILVYPKPKASISSADKDFADNANPEFTCTDASSIAPNQTNSSITSWLWHLKGRKYADSSIKQNTTFSVPNDTASYLLRLIATSNNGCRDTALRMVYYIAGLDIHLPGAFSPDGEGLASNNFYKPLVWHYRRFEYTILNRWGEIMFKGTDDIQGWDGKYRGKDCPQGTYVIITVIEDFEGYKHIRKGSLHLLR